MEVKMTNNYYNILAESITKKYATPINEAWGNAPDWMKTCLLYTSPSPRDGKLSRMPSSA